MGAIAKYAAVFGREPAVVREPMGVFEVSGCLFPPLKRSFWKSLMAEAHDQAVYVTAGMSLYSMPADPDGVLATRVELIATCDVPIGGGPTGNEDVPTAILQLIANHVLESKLWVGIGHTLDFQERLSPNSQMSGVLFAVPEGIDIGRVRRCTRAQEILSVVPITAPELALIRSQGIEALLDRFERAKVRPIFDYFRSSVA